MLMLPETDIAEAVKNQLHLIRIREDGDPDALDGLRWILLNIAGVVVTEDTATRHATRERVAVHGAVNRLVVAIEEGARGATIDGLWDTALDAAQAWVNATRTLN